MKNHKLYGLLSIKIAYIKNNIEKINTSTGQCCWCLLDNKVCGFKFAILFLLC